MLRNIAIFCLCFWGTTLAAHNFPRGCTVTGFGYKDNYLILNDTPEQTLFLIQNQTHSPIELEHVASQEVFMSPKLHSVIEPGQWSAFASDFAR